MAFFLAFVITEPFWDTLKTLMVDGSMVAMAGSWKGACQMVALDWFQPLFFYWEWSVAKA